MEAFRETGDVSHFPSPSVIEKYVKGEYGQKTGNKTRHSGRSGAESWNPEKALRLLDSRIRENDVMVDI